MAVHCSKCGEELMGAVNRCWKCGQSVASHPGPTDLPPVRGEPIEIPTEEPQPTDDETNPTTEPTDSTSEEFVQANFADVVPVPLPPQPPASRPQSPLSPRPTHYPRHTAATGGALGAVVLGIFSIAGAFFTALGAVVTALLGIAMGVWGLYSQWRGVAMFGLVLCCIAMILAGVFGAIELFIYINGSEPFDADLGL